MVRLSGFKYLQSAMTAAIAAWAFSAPTYAETVSKPKNNETRIEAQQAATPSPEIISLQMNYDFNYKVGPFDTGKASSLTFIPTIPFRITPNWNIISRTNLPLILLDDLYPGFGRAAGLTNIQQTFFLSPVPKDPGFVWGFGPTFFLPTASSKKLGSYQTGTGPAFGMVKAFGPWVFGLRITKVWSVAGPIPIGNKPLNFLYAEPMLSYTTDGGWTFSVNTESVYDWNDRSVLIPVNFLIDKLVTINNVPVTFEVGLRYFAASPENGPKGWGARVGITIVSFK
jgi:hypothetical protein